MNKKRKFAQIARAIALGGGLAVPFYAEATVVITNLGETLEPQLNEPAYSYIDLDGGGADFVIKVWLEGGEDPGSIEATFGTNNLIATTTTPAGYTAFFGSNDMVGMAAFTASSASSAMIFNGSGLAPGSTGFLGLAVVTNIGTNYGVLQVTRGPIGVDSFTLGLTGFETTPGVAIQLPLPEPATLALFGLGLAGIGAVRRKKLAA